MGSVIWVWGSGLGAGIADFGSLEGVAVDVDKSGGGLEAIQIQEYCVRPSEG